MITLIDHIPNSDLYEKIEWVSKELKNKSFAIPMLFLHRMKSRAEIWYVCDYINVIIMLKISDKLLYLNK
jgi:hypothetical protein